MAKPKLKRPEVKTHAQATAILYRIYRAIEDIDLWVRLNRKLGYYGQVVRDWDHGKTLMEFNPNKKDWGGTVLHECMHLVDWDLGENEIRELEAEVFDLITDRQLGNLVKRVFKFMRKSS